MKKYAVHGYFYAENIDHAFERLRDHFQALADGDDSLDAQLNAEPRYFEIYPIGESLVTERE